MGNLKFWEGSSRVETKAVDIVPEQNVSSTEVSIIRDGELSYTVAKAENGSGPSWQETVGAPVESHSPLGYNVGWLTVIFLNVNQMIGTGIFSTRKTKAPDCRPRFMILGNELCMLMRVLVCSGLHPGFDGLHRSCPHLLGHRFLDGMCRSLCVPGTGQLFPEQERRSSGLP